MSALADAAGTLRRVCDIVDGRIADDEPPTWCASRGWVDFLVSLTDEQLARCETVGLADVAVSLAGAPASLVELCHEIAAATRLPSLISAAGSRALSPEALRGVPQRKRLQLEAFLAACAPMAARCERVVDVGAGRGHLTRLAASLLDKSALGLEREAARVGTARELARRSGPTRATFRAFDAFREPLELEATDLVLGLHACGEVADVLLVAAARARAGVAFVSCCLQKIRGAVRTPLSCAGGPLVLRREALGLTNLVPREHGVERSTSDTMRAREARFALRLLLERRGRSCAPGEEMRGVNRRRARAGLAELAGRALAARGLAEASMDEIAACEVDARRRFATVRRLSLPRSLIGRLLEVAIALDRACYLEEQGYRVRVGTLFDGGVSPRNIAILAALGDAPMVRETSDS